MHRGLHFVVPHGMSLIATEKATGRKVWETPNRYWSAQMAWDFASYESTTMQ